MGAGDLLVGSGRYAGKIFEDSGEVTLICETSGKGNADQVGFRQSQLFASISNPKFLHVFPNRLPVNGPEHAR